MFINTHVAALLAESIKSVMFECTIFGIINSNVRKLKNTPFCSLDVAEGPNIGRSALYVLE